MKGDYAMKTRQFTRLTGMVLAVLLTLLVGRVGADDRKLEGTWNVTMHFGRCEAFPCVNCCTCPPGPIATIATLNTFLRHGAFLWASDRALVSSGYGSWQRTHHDHAEARYIFHLITDGSPLGYENLTKDIHLTGPDTFEATGTFDLFIAGNRISPEEGCPFSETATRFE
jgi:hypothetical protein